ncbi:MAG: hypothetical protein II719_05065, partial [Clostridia bacterium]|nr:hypothetical protein [Clostridia bacterium]
MKGFRKALVLLIVLGVAGCLCLAGCGCASVFGGGETAAPKGADSVRTLLDKSLQYLHSDMDYGKIKDVHDPVAFLAEYFIKDAYDYDLTFSQAYEKAELLFGSAEELKAKDPDLDARIRDEIDFMEPDEVVNEFMTHLRDALREGDIDTNHPKYELYSKMLADWDKGADYVISHYPEFEEELESRRIPLGMDGALKLLQKYARFEYYNNDYHWFKDLQAEYRPENTYIGEDGVCSYDIGNI